MPSSSPVADTADAPVDSFDEPTPKPRRRAATRARSRRKAAADDDFADGFGSGLGGDEETPRRKRAVKKAAAKKPPAKSARAAGEDGEAPEKKPARKRPARKKAVKKEEPIEEFDFDFGGGEDLPRVPINPAAAARVRKAASSKVDEYSGVSLPSSAAKALAAEKLAASLEVSAPSKRKKTRRGRRGKKDRVGYEGQQPAKTEQYSAGKPAEADERGSGEIVSGVLEMHPKGYGFLRDPKNNYVAQETDPFVSGALIDRFRLREGVRIVGEIGPGNRGQGPRLKLIESVDRIEPADYAEVPAFDTLTPVNPVDQIKLERDKETVSTRVMDLLTPLGKGQRALIVAPPRSGKTVLLREMADSIAHNHPEVHLIVLLIDERPEEVTEMERSVNGEVVASSLDHDVESHIRVSQLVIERAKRMAEEGRDVVVLLDSITRLARAFNKWTNSGRVTQGGIDIKALDIPKKLFGTARRFEEGGSVTVVGTVLVETGSRGDDVIFQEFKGTGNMELVLSRRLADLRIFPAIDIPQSSTRREELLLDRETHESVNRLRRSLISLPATQAMEDLGRTIQKFDTNDEFLKRVSQVM